VEKGQQQVAEQVVLHTRALEVQERAVGAIDQYDVPVPRQEHMGIVLHLVGNGIRGPQVDYFLASALPKGYLLPYFKTENRS